MYELIQAGARTYYIDCPAKIGIYLLHDSEVCLIDSGNDKEAGKKVLRVLEERGWRLTTILNTHSNADHIGGNAFLQQRTGCAILSSGIEAAITRYPMLEPSFLYGGYPCRELRGKFLLAQPSNARELTQENLPQGLEIIDLPGHFFGMIGIKTPDDVWFLADCLTNEAVLDKYAVYFIYDVAGFLSTLQAVEALPGRLFIPAHAEAMADIRPLVALNREKVLAIADKLLEICNAPLGFEEVLARVFDAYQLKMDMNQYVLVGSTIRSYLAYLHDAGRMNARFEENRMLWAAVLK